MRPGHPLCQRCYILHAGEVLAELAASGPDPATDFYRSTLRREQLQMAADVVAAADPGILGPGFSNDWPGGDPAAHYILEPGTDANDLLLAHERERQQGKPLHLPGEGFTIPVIEGGPG